MKPDHEISGDLGEFIVAELNRRGVPLAPARELPRLPATWQKVIVEMEGVSREAGVGVKGCSLDSLSSFLLLLLTPLRIHRPFSNDDDSKFWFSIDGKQGSVTRLDSGMAVVFIPWGITLLVGESDQELFIGFAQYR